jgi:hypothetical protein
MDDPTKEFLRHASECAWMVEFTCDPESKVAWRRMAESASVPRCLLTKGRWRTTMA